MQTFDSSRLGRNSLIGHEITSQAVWEVIFISIDKPQMDYVKLGKTGISIPKMVVGTSSLGNLYRATDLDHKAAIVEAAVQVSQGSPFFDSAGKYGAGMALEMLGKSLKQLGVTTGGVLISNKLGWKRAPLRNGIPTFEKEVWKGLTHDAAQSISYEGMIDCYEEGLRLLDGYQTQLVSLHDPDEYLAQSESEKDYRMRLDDIVRAYAALHELKSNGRVLAIGIGSKDWTVIREIHRQVRLDWVMIANSMTLYRHPLELLRFIGELEREGVGVINSAVFQSGFLVGGDYFDYRLTNSKDSQDQALFNWRERFFAICQDFRISPAHACIQFGLSLPGIDAIALNSTSPAKIKENARFCHSEIPAAFWERLAADSLIETDILAQLTTSKL